MDWSNQDYTYCKIEDLRNRELIGQLESTHVVLSFLFDFLHFGFTYMVAADKVPEQVTADEPRKIFNPNAKLNFAEDF